MSAIRLCAEFLSVMSGNAPRPQREQHAAPEQSFHPVRANRPFGGTDYQRRITKVGNGLGSGKKHVVRMGAGWRF